MTALQRAEDIGAKKIRDFLKSKGACAVSSSFRGRVDVVPVTASARWRGGRRIPSTKNAIDATVTKYHTGAKKEMKEKPLSGV
jgi:hypothetical protein